jgi:hypothetical protein
MTKIMKKQTVQRVAGRWEKRVAWTIKEVAKSGVKRMIHTVIKRLYHLPRMFFQLYPVLCEVIVADRQHSQLMQDTATNDYPPQDDDGRQFFRRIQVLYKDNILETTPPVTNSDTDAKKIFVLQVTGPTSSGSYRSCIV